MLACAVAFLFIALIDGFEGFRACDKVGQAAGILSTFFLVLSVVSMLVRVWP